MKHIAIILLILLVPLAGCTSMRAVDSGETTLTDQLEVGDHLIIYETSGRIIDMTLTMIDKDRLHGLVNPGSYGSVQVKLKDIEKIEVEKIDGVKTTLAVVGTVVILVPAAMIALLMSGGN